MYSTTENLSVITRGIRDQYQGTCYAHAFATVIRAAQSKAGFIKTPHDTLVQQATQKYGLQGANIEEVLKDLCPIYGMSWKKIDTQECEIAITEGQGIIAGFFLTNLQWTKFSSFFAQNPRQIMQKTDFIVPDNPYAEQSGHAVVINGRTQDYWKLKNSWGPNFADNGSFRISKLGLPFVYYKVYYLPKYIKDKYTSGEIDIDPRNPKRIATYNDIEEFDRIIKKLRGALVATNSSIPIPEEYKATEIKKIHPVFETGHKQSIRRTPEFTNPLRQIHGKIPWEDPYKPHLFFAKDKINKIGIQQFVVKVEGNHFAVGIASEIYHEQFMRKSEFMLSKDGASKNCYAITNLSEIFGDGILYTVPCIENLNRKAKHIPSDKPIIVTIDFERKQISFKVEGVTDTHVPMNSPSLFSGEGFYPVVVVYGKYPYKAEFL